MIINATSIILQIFIFLLLLIFTVLLIRCSKAKCVKKLHAALIWNSLIRLMMETYLELLLTSVLNLKFGRVEAEKNSTYYAMVLSVIVFMVLTIVPPVLCTLWWKRRENWSSEDFKARYGSLLQGVALDRQSLDAKSMLAVPLIFFVRRFFLVGAIILFGESAKTHFLLMVAVSMVSLSFFARTMPLESKRANRTEVFNEITMLMLLYTLLLFTQFVPLATSRYNCGYVYMFVHAVNLLTHLIIMVVLGVKGCILASKKKKLRQSNERKNKVHAMRLEGRKKQEKKRLLAMAKIRDENEISAIQRRRERFMDIVRKSRPFKGLEQPVVGNQDPVVANQEPVEDNQANDPGNDG